MPAFAALAPWFTEREAKAERSAFLAWIFATRAGPSGLADRANGDNVAVSREWFPQRTQ